jgi:putative aldouronate transport system substrate-binding protein
MCHAKKTARHALLIGFVIGLSAPAALGAQPVSATKYDPPIVASAVHQTGDQTVKFTSGDTFEDNVFTRYYRDTLGIVLKYQWVAFNEDANQKTRVMLASGSLPDIFMLNDLSQYDQLVRAGKLEDLTPYFEKYLSAYNKSIYSGEFERELDGVRRGGKLYTIPWFNNFQAAMLPVVWLRSDWLKRLKLAVPKTGEELFKVAEAFTSGDPDGDGKADTYGIAMDNAGIGVGYWNIFHAYPDIWLSDAKGNLSYGMYGSPSQAAATRQALLRLQDFYRKGIIRKDFATLDDNLQADDIIQGKCGIFFGGTSRPYFELMKSAKVNPEADWVPIAVPSIDARPTTISLNPFNYYGFYVVRKGYAHPEILCALLNQFSDVYNDPNAKVSAEEVARFLPFFKAAPFRLYDPRSFSDDYRKLNQALKSGDESALSATQKIVLANMKNYLATGDKSATLRGGKTGWADMKYSGPGGSAEVAEWCDTHKVYVTDAYFGPPTKSFTAKQPYVGKAWMQTFMDVVTGADITRFDDFARRYPKMGGAAMAREASEWQRANVK